MLSGVSSEKGKPDWKEHSRRTENKRNNKHVTTNIKRYAYAMLTGKRCQLYVVQTHTKFTIPPRQSVQPDMVTGLSFWRCRHRLIWF